MISSTLQHDQRSDITVSTDGHESLRRRRDLIKSIKPADRRDRSDKSGKVVNRHKDGRVLRSITGQVGIDADRDTERFGRRNGEHATSVIKDDIAGGNPSERNSAVGVKRYRDTAGASSIILVRDITDIHNKSSGDRDHTAVIWIDINIKLCATAERDGDIIWSNKHKPSFGGGLNLSGEHLHGIDCDIEA